MTKFIDLATNGQDVCPLNFLTILDRVYNVYDTLQNNVLMDGTLFIFAGSVVRVELYFFML